MPCTPSFLRPCTRIEKGCTVLTCNDASMGGIGLHLSYHLSHALEKGQQYSDSPSTSSAAWRMVEHGANAMLAPVCVQGKALALLREVEDSRTLEQHLQSAEAGLIVRTPLPRRILL